ncbi:MAG TPA: DMT family transporter [Actinomycetota bacterium]|nr:DMT family transporter [Actinomycetota bacterium]
MAVDGGLCLVVLMWASTFSLFKVAWREIDPVAFTGLRFGAMVVFAMGLLAASNSRTHVQRGDLPALLASGLTGYFAYQMGFILGLDRTSAIATAVLIATSPIWSILFAWAVGRERPSRTQLAGVLVGFIGVAVFVRAWAALGSATWGDLLSLMAAAAFGAYGVINQPLTRRYSGVQLMAYGLLSGGSLVALVGIPAMVHQDWSAVGATSWVILVYAVVGPVYLAYVLWNWAINRKGIARTVVYGFLTPVVAAAIAVLWLHEPVQPEEAAGAVLILAGLAISRVRSAREQPGPVAGEVRRERRRASVGRDPQDGQPECNPPNVREGHIRAEEEG